MNSLRHNLLTTGSTLTLTVVMFLALADTALALSLSPLPGTSPSDGQSELITPHSNPPSNGNGADGSEAAGTRGRG